MKPNFEKVKDFFFFFPLPAQMMVVTENIGSNIAIAATSHKFILLLDESWMLFSTAHAH